ncbi:SWIM zinc finger family protein [Rosistilla oblonga]|uniref:SWIM zinc finger family protein n=1 Tax=Rosistilla oblonga TaxID=2527990 RepID=UPI003A96CCE7
MISIDQAFVDSEAPNSSAISNGRGLLVKGKFVALHKSDDDTILFGECSGSGRTNYHCSCDFITPGKVTYRCSCPSRQFPCKHCIGLMYAFTDGKPFTVASVPEDLAAKREKLEQRVEKKKADATKPRKVNKSALKKKIQAQLDGLTLLEQLTHELIRTGMGNTNAKTAKNIEQQAKQLGNAYLPGAQSALHAYTKLFSGDDGGFDSSVAPQQREAIYSQALDQLTQLNALIKNGRSYLNDRLADPELAAETQSTIAAWLGHAWQLRELKEAGLVQENAELIQLAFNSYDDIARRELVDTGIWMNLGDGQLGLTQNFRPYKALKYVKAEDSFFRIAQVPELCLYPGDINPRIRWDALTPRPVEASDLQAVRQHAHSDFATILKTIKTHLKSPLADRRPIVALNYAQIGKVGDDLVVEDAAKTRIVFTETGQAEEPASCHLLQLLPPEMFQNQTLIGRFHHDLQARTLRVKPLSIVTDSQVFRLTF